MRVIIIVVLLAAIHFTVFAADLTGKPRIIDGDTIEIDIPNRVIRVDVSDDELAKRRAAMEAKGSSAWKPDRERVVSNALKAYAALTTSADRGAVRDVEPAQNPVPRRIAAM